MDFDGQFFVGRQNFGDFHNFYFLFLNDFSVRFTSAVSMAQRPIVYAKRIDTHVCQSNTHAHHSIAQTHTHIGWMLWMRTKMKLRAALS